MGAIAEVSPDGFGTFVHEIGLPDKQPLLYLTVLRPGLTVSLPQGEPGNILTASVRQSVPEKASIQLILASASGLVKRQTIRWKLRVGAEEHCGSQPGVPKGCADWSQWPSKELEGPGEHLLTIHAAEAASIGFTRWFEARLTKPTDPIPAVLSLAYVDAEKRLLGVQTVRWAIVRTPRPVDCYDRLFGLFCGGVGVFASSSKCS